MSVWHYECPGVVVWAWRYSCRPGYCFLTFCKILCELVLGKTPDKWSLTLHDSTKSFWSPPADCQAFATGICCIMLKITKTSRCCRFTTDCVSGLVERRPPRERLTWRPPRVKDVVSSKFLLLSQGRTCLDNCTCYHTETEVADPTFYLTQSQYTDTGPTSPSTDPITPGASQGSHWSANF